MHHPARPLAADKTNFVLQMEEESNAGEEEIGEWRRASRFLTFAVKDGAMASCLLFHDSAASFKPYDSEPAFASREHFVRQHSG
jgi:hypothetical protein